jgi:hypothetical protein
LPNLEINLSNVKTNCNQKKVILLDIFKLISLIIINLTCHDKIKKKT